MRKKSWCSLLALMLLAGLAESSQVSAVEVGKGSSGVSVSIREGNVIAPSTDLDPSVIEPEQHGTISFQLWYIPFEFNFNQAEVSHLDQEVGINEDLKTTPGSNPLVK